ncbi:MAG: bifunctional precorrin-2 dehydrogenase/sirohydrochlorin ferrochelatase [Actinomycetota bacterium]|nr:bifunctional precorrin-2 dehydrogenase/sirohydrochlorin ferrochelatase [Actinomycetota bacterium]MDA8280285.1 bifunctional precorrin-2 dehydrogenase/sirohydrochlorin ferrochelatase [Actinomycetota bacterium]
MLDSEVFPVGLVVAGRPCLVVGGGRVAARKTGALLRCGAAVTLVAPEAHVALGLLSAAGDLPRREPPALDVQLRPYRRGEAAGYRLVIAATGVAEVDQAVWDDAEAAGVWINCADDPAHCSVVLPAVHRDGPVTVAVSTGGASPALASWVRTRVAACVGPHLGTLARLLDEARTAVHAGGGSTEAVDWQGVLDGPLPELVRRGHLGDARKLLHRAVAVVTPGTAPT